MLDKLKALAATIWSDIKDTYQKIKIPLLAIGALILTLEFKKIKEALIVAAGKKEIQNDQKKDQALAAQEKTDNTQANALIQEAKDLPAQEQPVAEDWYTKEKK